jgi:hypothetical protein
MSSWPKEAKSKRSTKKYVLWSICAVVMVTSAIVQIYRGNLTFLLRELVNGDDFVIRGYQYQVSEEFFIFRENENDVFILYRGSNEVNHITVSKLVMAYFNYLIESKDTIILTYEDGCIIYMIDKVKGGMVQLFWIDDINNILLEATLEESLVENELICGLVKRV